MHDRKALTWFGALPEMLIHYGDDIIDLTADGRFDAVIDAIRLQLGQGHEPTVMRNHDDTSDQLGYVVDMEVLTLAEARARGITKQTSARMLYLGAKPANPGDLKNAIYGSVDLLQNIKDEEGFVHRYYLNELSVLPDPHIRRQQTPASELAMKFSAFAAPTFEDSMPDPKETTDAALTKDAQITTLTQQLEDVTAELVTARETIATLEGEKTDKEAGEEAAKLGQDEATTVKLKALYVRDKEAFTMAAALYSETATGTAPLDPAKDTTLTLGASGSRLAGKGVKNKEEEDIDTVARTAIRLRAKRASEGVEMTFAAAMHEVTTPAEAT